MKYQYFKSSLNVTTKTQAINLIYDGLQRDGSTIKLDQDQPTSLTVAETLSIVSDDFGTIRSESIINRSFDIFKQIVVTENDEVDSDHMVDEFSKEAFENLFNFADNILGSLIYVNDTQQAIIKHDIQLGIEYALRGSLIDEAPGDDAYIIEGTNISIMAGKVTSNGYNGTATLMSSRLRRRQLNSTPLSVAVPASALPDTNYAQITVITTEENSYNINLNNSDGVQRSGMIRVTIHENEELLSSFEDKAYSMPASIVDLEEPILIQIPYTGYLKQYRTISCGFTYLDGDTVNFDGIQSTVNDDNSVTCETTHLTDFVLEEHEDASTIDVVLHYPNTAVAKLNVYKAFAFWLCLLLFGAFIPLYRIARKKDIADILDPTLEWKLKKNKLCIYNLFWNKIAERPSIESEEGEPYFKPDHIGLNSTTDLNITAKGLNTVNVTTYFAERVRNNVTNKSQNLSHGDEDHATDNSYNFDNDISVQKSDDKQILSDRVEKGKVIESIQSVLNEEQKEPAYIDNIFGIPEIKHEELDNAKKDEILIHIKKRKPKKKKKVSIKQDSSEPSNIEQSLPVEEKQPEIIAPKFENKFEKIEKKEFKFEADNDDDYDGGEDDVSDKIEPYDRDDDYFHSGTGTNQTDPAEDNINQIKPKKRKKHFKKKKPKKIVNIGDEEEKADNNNFLKPMDGGSSPRKEGQRNSIGFNSSVDIKDTENDFKLLDGKEIENAERKETENKDQKLETDPNMPKKKRKFFTPKFFLRILKVGHRYVSFLNTYNEMLPRVWRLLILYIELFIMLVVSGLVFYNPGPKEDTDTQTGYSSFFYAILIICAEKLLHSGIIWIIIEIKMYGKRSDRYKLAKLLDREHHDDTALDQTDAQIGGGFSNLFSKLKKNAEDGKVEDTSKRDEKKNKKIFIGLFATTIIVALISFILIIVMGIRFSNHSGYLWLVTIMDILFFGHFCTDFVVLFCTGVLIHKKSWEKEDIY